MDDDVRTFRIQRELAMAAAMAVATTLMPVHRWKTRNRWAMHGGFGLISAVGCAWLMRHPEDLPIRDAAPDGSGQAPQQPPSPASWPTTVAMSTVVGAVAVGTSRGGEALDKAVEQALARRGLARPRWWLGAAAGLVSLAAGWAEHRGAHAATPTP